MRPSLPPLAERYALERDRYVLYVGEMRVLATRTVAVLIDTRLAELITHGDPASVRRELDEMRRIVRGTRGAGYDADWLLMEGRPQLDKLNAVLAGTVGADELREAYAGQARRSAHDEARALIARIARR